MLKILNFDSLDRLVILVKKVVNIFSIIDNLLIENVTLDSGGGLYYVINGRQYNIAIVNYGIGCAGRYPSVNTRLDR
jgi:hypothetical protein